MRVIGHCPLAGNGDAMHVAFYGDHAYVGHMGEDRVGTSVVDIANPRNPRVVGRIDSPPGTHSHKTEVVDDLLLVNCERNPSEPDASEWTAGIRIFDLGRDPTRPRELGFLPVAGGGVHRMTCLERPYVYMSAAVDGFTGQILLVADIGDPVAPGLVSRWWIPGMHEAGGETLPDWADGLEVLHHHVLPEGDRAYSAWWDGGVVALDVSDPAAPAPVWHWRPEEARNVHTAMPIPSRGLLVVAEETVEPSRPDVHHDVWMVDISDPDTPRTLAKFPVPEGSGRELPGRFGPHNLHEVRPQTGTLADDQRVYVTWFAGGVRVFDIREPAAPRELAYCIPAAPDGQAIIQLNDLAVRDDGLVYVTDRVGAGLFVIELL
jgi:hypothetical protein